MIDRDLVVFAELVAQVVDGLDPVDRECVGGSHREHDRGDGAVEVET